MTTSSATFNNLRVNMAEQFKESVSEPSPNTNIYLTFGAVEEWANESAPPTANSTIASVYEIWSNMIGGKRLFGSNFAHVIPKHNWTANTVFDAYDHMRDDLFEDNVKFYVVTSNYGVYKCLANNNGLKSNVEPTSLSTDAAITTSDGYTWKYMYTVTDSDLLRYTTPNYIPVKTLSADDGSLQWQVQDSATIGTLESIVITNGGSNYTNASTITVTIDGDGSDAVAVATINSSTNVVNSVIMTNVGLNYSWATITITDSGSGVNATARAIISPPGGHGSDPLYELGGKNVLVNGRLRYDEDDVFPTNNDFRQIALLKDPVDRSSNTYSNSTFSQTLSLTLAGFGDYMDDEIVYQGPSLQNYVFKGRVVRWDAANGIMLLINTVGTPSTSLSVFGTDSATVRTISNVTRKPLLEYSGKILYSSNFEKIMRASDQIEDFKIILHF